MWREWYFENESDDEELKDTRHYTLEERDIIIKAFYESDKLAERHAATLIWNYSMTSDTNSAGEKTRYKYPGVVKRLTEQGLIGQYLNPYCTRHTFITLQANNKIELPLLASICGTSVDVIYRHYLGFSKTAIPVNL